jgi:hypothetical protein
MKLSPESWSRPSTTAVHGGGSHLSESCSSSLNVSSGIMLRPTSIGS